MRDWNCVSLKKKKRTCYTSFTGGLQVLSWQADKTKKGTRLKNDLREFLGKKKKKNLCSSLISKARQHLTEPCRRCEQILSWDYEIKKKLLDIVKINWIKVDGIKAHRVWADVRSRRGLRPTRASKVQSEAVRKKKSLLIYNSGLSPSSKSRVNSQLRPLSLPSFIDLQLKITFPRYIWVRRQTSRVQREAATGPSIHKPFTPSSVNCTSTYSRLPAAYSAFSPLVGSTHVISLSLSNAHLRLRTKHP